MIDYDDTFLSLFRVDGSVMPSALLQSLPSTVFALLLCFLDDWWPSMREESGWAELGIVGLNWNAMTVCIGILLTLRIRQALGRFWEGTSLLHQMRGEWFDAASCLVSFSRDAKVNKSMGEDVIEFRSTLVRLMSLMHGSALDEISDKGAGVSYEVIDVGGLDPQTLVFLRECHQKCNFSKVEALQHLVQVLVTDNHHRGVLTIPPPILSRIYQTLSRGFVNLLNARKIKDTMFPFPFVQTIKVLLLVHSFVTPAVMTTVLNTNFWAVFFTFIPLFGLHCLNLAAWQLEMPFGADCNDLPLAQFQDEMNDTLLMLVSEGSDHCPRTSKGAVPLATLIGEVPVRASTVASTVVGDESTSFSVGKSSIEKSGSNSASIQKDTSLKNDKWNRVKIRQSDIKRANSNKSFDKRGRRLSCRQSNTRSIFDQSFLETNIQASIDGSVEGSVEKEKDASNTEIPISARNSQFSWKSARLSSKSIGDGVKEASLASITENAVVGKSKAANTLKDIYSTDTRPAREDACRTPPLVERCDNNGLTRKVFETPSDRDLVIFTPLTASRSRCHTPEGSPLHSPKAAQLREVGFDNPNTTPR